MVGRGCLGVADWESSRSRKYNTPPLDKNNRRMRTWSLKITSGHRSLLSLFHRESGNHIFTRVTVWPIGPSGTTETLPHWGCSHIKGSGRGTERGGNHPSMKGHRWHYHAVVTVLESEPACAATGRKPRANHSLVIPVLTVQKYTQKSLRPTSYERKSFI